MNRTAYPAEEIIFTADCFLERTSLRFDDLPEYPVIFYEPLSGRFFQSTATRVLMAEYYFNRDFVLGMSITRNDWFQYLGLTKLAGGDETGWDACMTGLDGIYWIDFSHIKVGTGKDTYYIIDVQYPPMSFAMMEIC